MAAEIVMGAWLVAGLVAGLLHATMLWRDVHRLTAWSSLYGGLRIAGVAAVLLVAALRGAILAAAAGWAIGFAASGTWFMIRRTRRADTPPRGRSSR